MTSPQSHLKLALITLTAIILAACGGGGGGSDPVVNTAPAFSDSSVSIEVAENTTGVIYTAEATDAQGNTITYSLSGGADQAQFSIGTSNGELQFAISPDYDDPQDSNEDNVYEVEISASDSSASSSMKVTVTVTEAGSGGGGTNQAPTASISVSPNPATTTLTTTTEITLDGSASSDPDDDTLYYTWSQPSGQAIQLSSTNAVSTTFTASAPGTYTFTLTVGDGELSDDDSVILNVQTITEKNLAPTANAGNDQTATEGDTVILSAALSSDDDAISSYKWSEPSSQNLLPSSSNASEVSFDLPAIETATTYDFTLTVHDAEGLSSVDYVAVQSQALEEFDLLYEDEAEYDTLSLVDPSSGQSVYYQPSTNSQNEYDTVVAADNVGTTMEIGISKVSGLPELIQNGDVITVLSYTLTEVDGVTYTRVDMVSTDLTTQEQTVGAWLYELDVFAEQEQLEADLLASDSNSVELNYYPSSLYQPQAFSDLLSPTALAWAGIHMASIGIDMLTCGAYIAANIKLVGSVIGIPGVAVAIAPTALACGSLVSNVAEFGDQVISVVIEKEPSSHLNRVDNIYSTTSCSYGWMKGDLASCLQMAAETVADAAYEAELNELAEQDTITDNEQVISDNLESSDVEIVWVATNPLNDTGIDWGGDYSSGNNTDCSSNISAPQDCHQGRDADSGTNDDSDGHAGFSFTKLDSSGNALTASATNWSCVQDNVTGLIWEVKTDDGSERDKDNAYRWGGLTAIGRDSSNREGSYYDDWNNLVNAANSGNGLCGFTDWRVPDIEELRSIVDYSRTNPSIDVDYFPNTHSTRYWSASPNASYSDGAWPLDFDYGYDYDGSRSYDGHVRLVRSGQ